MWTNGIGYTLYRTDYAANVDNIGASLDGESIQLGQPTSEGYEAQFNIPIASLDQLVFFGVRYEDRKNGLEISCGYMIIRPDQAGTIANSASSTAVVIDKDNVVAQIAMWEDTSNRVASYNVYNDRILFFNKNARNDYFGGPFKVDKNWGQIGKTIFEVNGGAQFALAPYSEKFVKIIADGTNGVSIATASLRQDGTRWIFQVDFNFGGVVKQVPYRSYQPDEQVTCSNPPFIYTVQTVRKDSKKGHEIVMVSNMRNAADDPTLDSNDLAFQIAALQKHDLSKDGNYFVDESTSAASTAYIQVSSSDSSNRIYYGQIQLPLKPYELPDGFHPLMDQATHCAAFLLVVGSTTPQQQIIPVRVFDNNLILFADEKSRANIADYQMLKNSGLLIEVGAVPGYQAFAPLSRQMLQIIWNHEGNLSLASTPICTYNAEKNCYDVAVQVNKGDGNTQTFQMTYQDRAVVKCDNFPFVLPLVTDTNQYLLARFNNEMQVNPQKADGSAMAIERFDEVTETYAPLNVSNTVGNSLETVSVSQEGCILKMQVNQGGSSYSCHVLYQITNPYKMGVYVIRLDETGAQHVFDFYDGEVREVTVFTNYMMWTVVAEDTFANGANCKRVGQDNRVSSEIFSIPITMEFSKLMEQCGLSIASHDNVKYYVDLENKVEDIARIDNYDRIYVEVSLMGLKNGSTIVKAFPQSNILKFEDYQLPTLTVFPFVNFVAGDGYDPEMQGEEPVAAVFVCEVHKRRGYAGTGGFEP